MHARPLPKQNSSEHSAEAASWGHTTASMPSGSKVPEPVLVPTATRGDVGARGWRPSWLPSSSDDASWLQHYDAIMGFDVEQMHSACVRSSHLPGCPSLSNLAMHLLHGRFRRVCHETVVTLAMQGFGRASCLDRTRSEQGRQRVALGCSRAAGAICVSARRYHCSRTTCMYMQDQYVIATDTKLFVIAQL